MKEFTFVLEANEIEMNIICWSGPDKKITIWSAQTEFEK